MKRDLKRIEAALHQIADQSTRYTLPGNGVRKVSPMNSTATTGVVAVPVTMRTKVSLPTLPDEVQPIPDGNAAPPAEVAVPPLSACLGDIKVPTLPRIKSPTLSSHRNAANPTLAMGLLKEMELTVAGWQDELQQVLRQIQDLYLEGPIVDGWMESYAQQEGESPMFRHADVNCLMDYVEKMRNSPLPEGVNSPAPGTTAEAMATGYRLCGLNEDGQLWFRHCPSAQVPAVSLAIARYQRLRSLLTRKQYLENRLSLLAETLVGVHSQMNS